MTKKMWQQIRRACPLLKKAAAAMTCGALAASLTPAAAFAAMSAAGAAGVDRSGTANQTAADGEYVEGEILVQFDNAKSKGCQVQSFGALSSSVENALGAQDVELVAKADKHSGSVVEVKLAQGESIEDAVAAAKELPGVASAQPNYIYRLLEGTGLGTAGADGKEGGANQERAGNAALFDDPDISYQYYLGNWGADGDASRGASVTEAWDKSIAQHNVSIAVLDTGIRLDHEDLAQNIDTVNMWDAYTYPDAADGRGKMASASNPTGDKNGHGSHVAGIAAGTAGNGTGIAGASGNANIVPIKVFDNQSYQPGAQTKTLVSAYKYLVGLVDAGVLTDLHVINMSLGSYASEGADEYDLALKEQIGIARGKGILTVCAGGNGLDEATPRTDAMYPSDYDDVLSVTALNQDGTNAAWSDYNAAKDISAPGVDIWSCYNQSPQSYKELDGTSMASPLVAGISSLLWAAKPTLTVDEAVAALETTANPLDKSGANYHGDGNVAGGSDTGSHGAVDAAAAVASVASGESANYKRMADYSIDAIDTQLWTGQDAIEPAVVVRSADGGVLDASNYDVRYIANKAVGTATVMAVGKGSYIGSTKREFSIKYDFSNATGLDVVLSKTQFDADGKEHKPDVLGVHNRADKVSTYVLEQGVDFEAAWPADASSAGTKSVTVTGKGDYQGTRTLSYKVGSSSDGGSVKPTPAPAPTPAVKTQSVRDVCTIADIPSQAYTGLAIRPALTVTSGKVVLEQGKDYNVAYAYNVDAGQATAMIYGMGSYTGSLAKRFTINPANIGAAVASVAETCVYTGESVCPAVKLSLAGKELAAGEDFVVAYSNNDKPGTASAAVSGIGNYTGNVQVGFEIAKGAQKLVAKAKAKKVAASKLAKKRVVVGGAIKVGKIAGKVSFKKLSGSKALGVMGASGKLDVAKGTPKGIYKAKVLITAAPTELYKAASKKLTVTVKVK